jgi:hypothetical protein
MIKRKRHNYKWDKDRLRKLNYKFSNIITKEFLSDEYVNDEPIDTILNASYNFYANYPIWLPINSFVNELSTERI